jgi:hypothetical protein
METLGLSDSTPRSNGRLKSLFWPSIQTATDVDYLGTQGYWVCTLIAVLSLVVLVATGQTLAGLCAFLLLYLGGVGVRERSRYAAAIVLLFYATDAIISGVSVLRIFFASLLLSNLRATWIAAQWKPESDDAAFPPRLNETLGDKLADQLPPWLWPKVRIVYYIFSVGYVLAAAIGLWEMSHRVVH